MGVVAPAYVRGWRKIVVSSAQPLPVGCNDAWFITPAQTGNADRANYYKQQHPGSCFLEVKGKLHSQEMPAVAGKSAS